MLKMLRSGIRFALLICAAFTAYAGPAAASNAAIDSTPSQEVKGWGTYPSFFNSEWGPTFVINTRPAIADAVYKIGMTYIRCEVVDNLYTSGTTIKDIQFDPARFADLETQIALAKKHGVNKYILSIWSPPAAWKVNGSSKGDTLIAADEPYLVAYYTKVILKLKADGFALPINVSVQNEPDLTTSYPSCDYFNKGNYPLWVKAVEDLRDSLDQNGLSAVQIVGPECTATDNDGHGIANWDANMKFHWYMDDPKFARSLNAFGMHGYGENHWTSMRDAWNRTPTHERWVTEWCDIRSGSNQQSVVDSFRHMGANFVDLGINYWTNWMEWIDAPDGKPAPPGASFEITGDQVPVYTPLYWLYQKLFTSVPPGWFVHHMTTDDPGYTTSNSSDNPGGPDPAVDLVSFWNPAATRCTTMLVNPSAKSATTMTITGLVGATYKVYQTTATTDSTKPMPVVATGTVTDSHATVTLAPYSVSFMVTTPSTIQPSAPTGLKTLAREGEVFLKWTPSAHAANYTIYRGTASGKDTTAVATKIVSPIFADPTVVKGTTYYYRIKAVNDAGVSAASNAATATSLATPDPKLTAAAYFADATGPYGGNQANSSRMAYDGNPDTFYDCAAGAGFTGIDLGAGNTKAVSSIRYLARRNWVGRMMGGIFEGSNNPTTGYTTLATVTSASDITWTSINVDWVPAYRYLRYRTVDGNCDVAEVEFHGH